MNLKLLKSDIPLALGKDVEGNILISGMEDMPHLLIAGAAALVNQFALIQ